MYSKRVETWNTRKGKVAKVAVRDNSGRFHGSTNYAERSKVGQVATSRR